MVGWAKEEGSRHQLGLKGLSIFTGKRQFSMFLTDTAKDAITVVQALQTMLSATPDVAQPALGFEVTGGWEV